MEDGVRGEEGERKKGAGGKKEHGAVLTGGEEKIVLKGQGPHGRAVQGRGVELLRSRWREKSTLWMMR